MSSEYNEKKFRMGYKIKNKDLIRELQKLNPNAQICCCGSDTITINVHQDESLISLDYEFISDAYPDNMDCDQKKYIIDSGNNFKINLVSPGGEQEHTFRFGSLADFKYFEIYKYFKGYRFDLYFDCDKVLSGILSNGDEHMKLQRKIMFLSRKNK